MAKFSKEMFISDVLRSHPQAAKVLGRFGLMCAGCGGAENETIAHAAHNYGIALDDLLDQLNALGPPARE